MAAERAAEAADGEQRQHMHHHVGAVRVPGPAAPRRCGLSPLPSYSMIDSTPRSEAGHQPGSGASIGRIRPPNQGRPPPRLGDGFQDQFHPVHGRDGVIVDIGDVRGSVRPRRRRCAPGSARLFQADQPRVVLVAMSASSSAARGEDALSTSRIAESVAPDRLLAQPVQAVQHMRRTIMGADANGQVNPAGPWRKKVEEEVTSAPAAHIQAEPGDQARRSASASTRLSCCGTGPLARQDHIGHDATEEDHRQDVAPGLATI